jgi:CHRD domain
MYSKVVAGFAAAVFLAGLFVVPASADILTFDASLSGPDESPTNNSPGTGNGVIVFDTGAGTMHVNVSFGGLTTPTIASHIHCCTTSLFSSTAIVATTLPTFPNFPLGVTSGTYDQTFNMLAAGSYNPAFLSQFGNDTGLAFAALVAGAFAGTEYLNIHTTMFPSGEIRAFLIPTPLPMALPLFATGLGALGLLGWRRRKAKVCN